LLPRWHIILGAAFALVIWIIIPATPIIYIALIFLSSFLIDFDHYVVASRKTKSLSLRRSLHYHNELGKKILKDKEKGIREKSHFYVFHTVEFHILVAIIGIFYNPFFYIFIGMVFHSILDLYWMLREDLLYIREFFFFNYTREKFGSYTGN